MENTRFVNKGIVKKDAKALLSGRPVYTDDIAPSDCLVVKLLRSPHAHAWIEDISTAAALKVPGIEAVFTYKDVPEKRYTQAGQTFPEPSPDDRLILTSIFDIMVTQLRLLRERMRTVSVRQ